MIRWLRWCSIENLRRGRRGPSTRLRRGQIATFMLLVIVVILILAMVTSNIGDLSMRATSVANAADAASLFLASQLASRGYQMWDSLDGNSGDGDGTTKRCRKRGWLGIILAVVVALIAIFTQQYWLLKAVPTLVGAGIAGGTAVSAITAGAIGGAVGGAIGGGIEGTGALRGALQGAAIGAAIGGGLTAFHTGTAVTSGTTAKAGMAGAQGAMYTVPAGMEGTAAATGASSMSGAWIAAPGMVVPQGATLLPLAANAGSVIIPTVTGAAIGGTLAVGSAIYNKYSSDRQLSEAFSSAAKALNGLPDYQRIQQGVILEAMNRLVDDPNTVVDTQDLDGDGDDKDRIPRFLEWWADRIDSIRTGMRLPNIPDQIRRFATAMETFRDEIAPTFAVTQWPPQTGLLARQELEGRDGPVVQVARAMDSIKQPLPFWLKGPTMADVTRWNNELTCHETVDGCPANLRPQGIDEVDQVIEILSDLAAPEDGTIDSILNEPSGTFLRTWSAWAPWFYDRETGEDANDDAHEVLGIVVNGHEPDGGPIQRGLSGWKDDIEQARKTLRECDMGVYGAYGGYRYPGYQVSCQPGWGYGYGYRGWGQMSVLSQQDCALNPPCKVPSRFTSFIDDQLRQQPINHADKPIATADADFYVPVTPVGRTWGFQFQKDDEFEQAVTGLEALAQHIDVFRRAAERDLANLPTGEIQNVPGGAYTINPGRYPWTDSAGEHVVEVEVGRFKLAQVKKKKSFWKICLVLKDYKDDGSKAYVEIDRTDPMRNLGLWRWNPFGGDWVRKTGRARYGIRGERDWFVELAGTRRP